MYCWHIGLCWHTFPSHAAAVMPHIAQAASSACPPSPRANRQYCCLTGTSQKSITPARLCPARKKNIIGKPRVERCIKYKARYRGRYCVRLPLPARPSHSWPISVFAVYFRNTRKCQESHRSQLGRGSQIEFQCCSQHSVTRRKCALLRHVCENRAASDCTKINRFIKDIGTYL